ncbi:MAG: hypothetical protein AAFO04_13000 [Cyanobacteria bacterium J06592_8]
MKEKKQREVRRHAAEHFLNSFEQQLLDTFQESESEPTAPTPPPAQQKKTKSSSPESIDLSALEDAIADIDQYLENQSSQSGNF